MRQYQLFLYLCTNAFFGSTSRIIIDSSTLFSSDLLYSFRGPHKVVLRSVFRALGIQHYFYYKSDWAKIFCNVTKNVEYSLQQYWNTEIDEVRGKLLAINLETINIVERSQILEKRQTFTQLAFTSSKSATETSKQCVKSVQS